MILIPGFEEVKRPIFITDKERLELDNVQNILNEHQWFKSEKYYRNLKYYEGYHEILNRTMEDPKKPNNTIVVNLPSFTTDIRTGYFSGEPLTFSSEDDNVTETINNILDYNDFQDVNTELDRLTSIYGHAFLILYMDKEANVRFATETPDNMIIVYDNSLEKNIVGAVRYYYYTDVSDNEQKVYMTVYNKDMIEYYNGKVGAPELVDIEENYFDGIPVIEFVENENRKGCYEDAISLVDAIESVISSSVNEIEYFDNAYLLLKNLAGTEKEDIDKMKENRVMLVEDDGDAEFITKTVDDDYTQNLLNRLVNDYHKVTKTPNLTDEKFAGNVSGVSLKFKLFALEKDMAKKESKWKKSIQRMLELICTVLNIKGTSIDYRTIKITFTRALPTNTLEQAQMVSQLSGIVSRETLLAQLDFIENPKQEIELIDKEQEEQMKKFDMYADSNVVGDPKEDDKNVNNNNSMDSSNS